MRIALILVAALLGGWAVAQDKAAEQKPKAKAEKKKAQGGRQKPTPEQLRKFNELEKKQQK